MSAQKTATATTGTSPPPDADASHDEDLPKPSSKNLLAVLHELNMREARMLDTTTNATRACLNDMKSNCKCLSNNPDNDYVQRYNGMAKLNKALAGLVDAEQSLRTFLLQLVPGEGNVWQQQAVEAQEMTTAAFQKEFRRSVSVMNEGLRALRTIISSRELGKVEDGAESEAGERGIAKD